MRTLAEWLAWQQTLHPSAVDLGLDRVRGVLQRLQWRRPSGPVITIGGTNGKGSCAALTAAILGAAGLRAGVFSSPHLIRYQERITIAGREAQDAELIAAFERIDEARGSTTLTFFEFNTLAALLLFEAADTDAIVLEVGMGGRLDAVNVVDSDVALVTSVALDHCEWLGRDLEAIGCEKAGIYRAGRPAVFGSRAMPASIEESARMTGAELLRLGRDFDFTRAGDRWSWRGRRSEHPDLPRPALPGDAQFDNASAVLCALECISAQVKVSRSAIEQGLESVRLPGRFQVLRQGELEWILDVAHNPAAAQTLASQLAARPAASRTIAVCGILADKDIEGAAAPMLGVAEQWVIAGLASERSLPAQELANRIRRMGAEIVAVEPDVRTACEAAKTLARPGDRIVVFGSFLTVGPALEFLNPPAASR